ncbi:MAG: phage portal protein [Mucinivorans sp.]
MKTDITMAYSKPSAIELFRSDVVGVQSTKIWRWGSDNMLPEALSQLSRNCAIHRRILSDKTDYITGRGFDYDHSLPALQQVVQQSGLSGQNLRSVLWRVVFDKNLFGNGFLEIVVDEKLESLNLFHQDASRCRLSRDGAHIVLHHNWRAYFGIQAKELPLFPRFEWYPDHTYRSIIHYKQYEPMFENYGLPKYIASLGAVAIAYKTDRWNISRLENAFQPSGVMVLDGEVDTKEQAQEIAKTAEKKFAGNPGQVMFMVKNGIEGDTSKFVPINSSVEGHWRGLHEQAAGDIIVAHSWFRTLSGIDYSTGFSPDRIQYEYQIALSTLINVEQQDILDPIKMALTDLLNVDSSSLQFINRPPFQYQPKYLKVWEARRADGYDYDPSEEGQNKFLSEI